MVAPSRRLINEAERRFPCRVMIAVPPAGFGEQLNLIYRWLDQNCGVDGWGSAPAGRSVVNDALAIYFRDATMASAFVSRWCLGYRIEPAEGLYQMREDSPVKRVPAKHHKTP
jgi:hypothetical protein